MAPTRKRAARPPIALIVRRGALRRFDALKKRAGDIPVTVLWDRRIDQRPRPSVGKTLERRQAERRQQPPFTWDLADFVVVEGDPRSPRKKAR